MSNLLIIFLGFAWLVASRDPSMGISSNTSSVPQVGFRAPDFELSTPQGEIIRLSSLRGQPVIVNLWASWCPPCRAEMPALQNVHADYQSDGLVVLGVNATNQDRLEDALVFLDKNGLTFPILLDKNGEVSQAYQLRSLPTTFFIDRNGVIKEIIIGGPMAETLLRVRVENLLGALP